MKYLGTCTLQLGAHLYENTNFYEATRTDSWKDIAIKQGLMKPAPPPPPPPTPQVNPENKPDVVMQDAIPQPEGNPDVVMEEAEKDAVVGGGEKKDAVMEKVDENQASEANEAPSAVPEQSSTKEADTEKSQEQPQTPLELNTKDEPQVEASVSADTQATTSETSKKPESVVPNVHPQANGSTESQQPETQPQEIPDEKLTFVDIVFELKEFPNERFIFPKDAIIQSTVTGPNPDDCFVSKCDVNQECVYLWLI